VSHLAVISQPKMQLLPAVTDEKLQTIEGI